jgi:hypothetical protein
MADSAPAKIRDSATAPTADAATARGPVRGETSVTSAAGATIVKAVVRMATGRYAARCGRVGASPVARVRAGGRPLTSRKLNAWCMVNPN